jgi:hypothetical protein
MKRIILTAIIWCWCACALADICAVKDLGLVPDDPTVDNAAILTQAVRENRVNDSVRFPGGAYYASTTVDLGVKAGLAFIGQGLVTWDLHPGNFTNPRTGAPQRLGNASVRWIYTGDDIAWKVCGDGTRIIGINLWHGWKVAKDKVPERWGKAKGFYFDTIGAQNGQWHLAHLSVCGFDEGMVLTGHSQVDLSHFGFLWMESNRTHFRCDSPQTTCLKFDFIQSIGVGETVFEIDTAGDFSIDVLSLIDPRTVFKFLKTGSNTCNYHVEMLKVDNNAAGWRLVEMLRPGPLNLTVSGLVGKKALPGERPVVLRRSATMPDWYTRVRLDLWPPGWNERLLEGVE